MAKRETGMVCTICGKENHTMHQDFCRDLGCSGRMVSKTSGSLKRRSGTKFITALPDNEECVGMLMFKGTMYVATGKGVYKMVGDKLEPVQFVVKDDLYEHGKDGRLCTDCGQAAGE